MTNTPLHFTLWIGALLLRSGHVVQVPGEVPALWVHTKKAKRRLFVSLRDEPVSRTQGRIIIGTVAELEEDMPDVVVIVAKGNCDPESVVVVPVASTREQWISEGRHYAVDADKTVDLQRLNEWLTKSGRP